jgi:hypothetical protein
MMTRARWVALGLAALAGTFWLGMRAGAPAGGEQGRARVIIERATAAPAVVHAVAGASGLTREDIRAVVREELAQHAQEAAETAPAAEVISAERLEQAKAAVASAHGVISDGVARGVWGERERAALRPQLIQLGPAETREVLSPLFHAINAQRIQLDGPPI